MRDITARVIVCGETKQCQRVFTDLVKIWDPGKEKWNYLLLDLKRFLQNYQFQATMVNSAPDAQRKTLRQDFVNPQDKKSLWPVYGIKTMFDLSLVCKDCQISHWGRKSMLGGGHTRDKLSSDLAMGGKGSRDKLPQLYKCSILRVYKAAAQKADMTYTHLLTRSTHTFVKRAYHNNSPHNPA